MKGVDTTQELAMRSFTKLHEILDQLKETRGGLEREVEASFRKSIDSGRLYLKTNYYRNLAFHSEVKSHCVGLACSDNDPKAPEFAHQCFGSHSKSCEHCDNLQDLFEAFMGLLQRKRSDFVDDMDFIEAEHEVNEANERVWAYRQHIVRTWIQQVKWTDILNTLGPGTAMVTSDWAMKFEPKRWMETQLEWYGKKVSWLSYSV